MMLFFRKKHVITHREHKPIVEIIGWVGTAVVLLQYALLSFGLITANNVYYHSGFLFGAFTLALITYRHRAYQSFVVNIVFVFLASAAIIRLLFFS